MAKDSALTLPGSQRAAVLLQEIKRQSQPRRWPWQDKTIRDLIEERRSDMVELALVRSAQLAASATEQREILLEELQRQTRPRRWPWQQQTAYDKIAAQRQRVANAAIERANALTEAATTRRDTLLAEARRQSQPRRWPWQEKTLRDKLADQGITLLGQSQPTFWSLRQPSTRKQIDKPVEGLRTAVAEALPALQESASATAQRVRSNARSTADLVQQQIVAAPQKLSTAAEGLRDTSQQVANRLAETADLAAVTVRETAGSAASSVKAAAKVPVESVKAAAKVPVEAVRTGVEASQHAVNETVESSKRSVRRGVRAGRVFLWALLIGGILGLLFAPRTGDETRRNLQALWDRILETVVPAS